MVLQRASGFELRYVTWKQLPRVVVRGSYSARRNAGSGSAHVFERQAIHFEKEVVSAVGQLDLAPLADPDLVDALGPDPGARAPGPAVV
jgi:hypothetical protein